MADAPALTVLVVTSGNGATVRRTLQTLRAQTIVERIELFLIGLEQCSFDDLAHTETEGFRS